MALTDFEKNCIDDILLTLNVKDFHRRTATQQADYNTITHGTEAERQVLIAAFITNTGLAKIAADIAGCDAQTAQIVTIKADLEAKQTEMQSYGG